MTGTVGTLAGITLAVGGGAILAGLAAALLLLASIPSRARDAARITGIFVLVLTPVIAIGYGLQLASKGEPLAWLVLAPITLAWLALLDLRWGVSGRVTKGLPKGATKKATPKPPEGPGANP